MATFQGKNFLTWTNDLSLPCKLQAGTTNPHLTQKTQRQHGQPYYTLDISTNTHLTLYPSHFHLVHHIYTSHIIPQAGDNGRLQVYAQ